MSELERYRKRLGCRRSPWDNERLQYIVRSPTYEEALKIPDEFDGLAEWCKCLGDQGDIGDCTGWAGKGAETTLAHLNDKRSVNFSAGSIYYHSREYADPPIPANEEGSTPLAILKLLVDKGATTEECAPTVTTEPFVLNECGNWQDIAKDFVITTYHQVPSDQASMQAAIFGITYQQPYKMPDGSDGKSPLYIAIDVYESFMDANSNGGLVSVPKPGETLLGGHAVLIRGWKKIKSVYYWVMVNSWGTSVGDKGIYYLPFNYPIAEAWMITEDQPVPGPEPAPRKRVKPQSRIIKHSRSTTRRI